MEDPVKRMKRQTIDWDQIFANHLSAKDYYLERIKNPPNSTKQPDKKMGKRYKQTFH